ncbi:TetR/AcrR family transcriptional regulator [Kribbella sp. NPDC056345]|uniref:TetR/AcrR family transcriptional regulator n=1 Tax=Kribbella sp. NPDC056345 TaxID=3345789 RepID=UPI0035D9553B
MSVRVVPAQSLPGTAGAATPEQVLDTAAAVLAKDPAASLGQIALAARIGRTTLHKQFPTRHDLLVAVASRALDISESVVAAAPDDPDPLRRMVVDLLPFGACLTLLTAQPEIFSDDAITSRTDALTAPIAAIVASAGTIRPGVPDWWLVRSLHALLFTAWDLLQAGWLAPRDAPDLVLSTFTGGVLTR